MTPSGIHRRDLLKAAAGAVALTAAARAGAASSTPPEDRWQIGIYTRPWDKFDWRLALDAIAEAGYRHAGLMTTNTKNRLVISVETTLDEAQTVGDECRKRGLRVPSVYGGGIPVGESLVAGIAGMRRLIDNCAACGAANLLMGGTGNKNLYDRYYKAIAETCAYAAAKGVGISIKPHGGLNATGPQCRKTVETVGHPNFRIWYDPGNIYYYSNGERDPVDDAPTVAGLVVGMCVKDYVHPKKVAVTPGEGRVDFPKVMQRLKAGGFTAGALVVECLSPGDEKHLLAEAKKARRFVENLVA
jgi:sugar phosphate isomerase/epimerase